MAGSVNKVIIVGNLGRDPETRSMQDGRKVVNMSVATSEAWKDKRTGERHERVEWHKVVIFNEHLAGVAEKYLTKGTKVYLEGSLQTRKWADQENRDRYVTEIVLGNFKGELNILSSGRGDGGNESAEPQEPAARPPAPAEDDEIPF